MVGARIGGRLYHPRVMSRTLDPLIFRPLRQNFLSRSAPRSLVPAPVSPFQGGPDLYHLPPAGTKAPPPSYSGHVSTSIPPLYASDTYISRWLAFSRAPIKPFLNSVEILNVRIFASFPPSWNLPQFHSLLGLRYYESEILSYRELLHECHLQDKLKVNLVNFSKKRSSFHSIKTYLDKGVIVCCAGWGFSEGKSIK